METLVIIGGGFAGLNLIKHIKPNTMRIKLIDRNNYHYFPPLFYQIASSGLAPSNISFPLRREMKKCHNFTYHLGHVKNIDVDAQTVTTSYETIHYDRLVIAAGSTNNHFGMDHLEQTTFGMKTLSEAIRLREEILDRLERGALCGDPQRRRKLLTFMVVGGGPAGVEIAGAIGEMKKYVLKREYPELNPSEMVVALVEGSDRLLAAMDAKCSAKAKKYLQELDVDVRLNTHVSNYEDKYITYTDGRCEYCETLIWTTGIKGEPMPGLPTEAIGHGGRIPVDEYSRVKGIPKVYAIGDIALMESKDYPHGHPQVAQVAIQQGRTLAHNLNASQDRQKPFKYHDKDSMATIGRNRAVVRIGNMHIGGLAAWISWMGVHLVSLLGMRNKLMVMFNWIWNYFTYSTSLRLLIRPTVWPKRKHWGD